MKRSIQVKVPESKVKTHATSRHATSPSSPWIIRRRIRSAHNQSRSIGWEMHTAQHMPLLYFGQRTAGIVIVVFVLPSPIVGVIPKMKSRATGHGEYMSRRVKAQTDNGIVKTNHAKASSLLPVPDAHLTSEAATRYDVVVLGMVLDRPRCARMTFECFQERSSGAASDLDRMITMSGSHGLGIGRECDRYRTDCARRRRPVRCAFIFLVGSISASQMV